MTFSSVPLAPSALCSPVGFLTKLGPSTKVRAEFIDGRLAGPAARSLVASCRRVKAASPDRSGRAVSILFAREGANIAVVYLEEDRDAEDTQGLVEAEGARCLLIKGDVGSAQFCAKAVEQTVSEFGGLDVLVNNAAEQHKREELQDITEEQMSRTFRTNFFGYVFMTQAALPQLKTGSTIINTTSVTAYRGHPELVDYASTKGAIVSFTRSLATQLAEKEIRVNAVAPGPIWTPLIPATFDSEKVANFGKHVPLGRAGQPSEVAPCHLFLACEDSSYITGQVLHPNGGEMVGG